MPEPLASPEPLPDLLRRAQMHHARSELAAAKALYRHILEREPTNAPALGLLALILVNRPDDPEAEAIILRHLALRPNDGASLHALGQLRAYAGNDTQAVSLFLRAIQWLPGLAPIHNDLGVSLSRLGRAPEALAAFERAAAIDPAYAAAYGNRAAVLADLGRFSEAFDTFRTTLAATDPAASEARAPILDGLARTACKGGRVREAEAILQAEVAAGRDNVDVIEPLSLVLERLRRPDEALTLRNDLARRMGVQRSGPADAEITVLVLGGVGAGHVPIRYLLDASVFATRSVSLLSPDQSDAPLGAIDFHGLGQVDVIFSTLGDIDRGGGQFEAATALCARLGLPVINPPAAIERTGRDKAAALFGDIPGLITPVVSRMTREGLGALPIDAPLLARPAGDHGGDNLVLLSSDADRTAWLADQTADQLLVSPFHDFASVDGLWRKYRLIFIDRQVYPYHLAIGEHWLVHYWRTEMGRADWKMAEEQRFLADWRGVFGPVAARAAEAVARRLDLDYGGMDCALMADGRLLLFEANACMLVHLDEPIQTFAYKHQYVPPIREAFTRMVRARAGAIGRS